MSGEHEVFVESSVQGYHTYFKYSTVSVQELMMCEIKEAMTTTNMLLQ